MRNIRPILEQQLTAIPASQMPDFLVPLVFNLSTFARSSYREEPPKLLHNFITHNELTQILTKQATRYMQGTPLAYPEDVFFKVVLGIIKDDEILSDSVWAMRLSLEGSQPST